MVKSHNKVNLYGYEPYGPLRLSCMRYSATRPRNVVVEKAVGAPHVATATFSHLRDGHRGSLKALITPTYGLWRPGDDSLCRGWFSILLLEYTGKRVKLKEFLLTVWCVEKKKEVALPGSAPRQVCALRS